MSTTRRFPHASSSSPSNNNSNNKSPSSSSAYLRVVLLTAIPSFFLGATASLWIVDLECSNNPSAASSTSNSLSQIWLQGQINQRVQQEKLKWKDQQNAVMEQRLMEQKQEFLKQQQLGENNNNHNKDCPPNTDSVAGVNNTTLPLFPYDTVGRFAVGMVRTPKEQFTQQLDLGVPVDLPDVGSSDVLLLYSRSNALPDALQHQQPSVLETTIPLMDTRQALQNCDFLNVVLTDRTGTRKQCIAIVPQYESYHVQKWMRLADDAPGQHVPDDAAATQKTPPLLQLVSRGRQPNGRDQFHPPALAYTRKNWDLLQQYFKNVDAVLAELKVVLEKIAVDNTVIVMVCNFGQAELLMNFVCAAQQRHLDISNVVVFTTDQETTDLVTALGITAFFDHRNFGDIPAEAAQHYGDSKFVAMMMAKVICVQLVSMLGYDFLFQDVDIVWYQNPLEYFSSQTSAAAGYDIFFQDDGGHSVRYAPYSANSGFYFVRANDRTRHFLTSLLMAGDLVLSTSSHQQALIAALSEHVSLFGLRAKVLSRDQDEFPGGYQFHQKSGSYMRAIFNGTIHPYIFHMSWTLNKDNKLLFFQQMGEWYVHEECRGKKVNEIGSGGMVDVKASCCSAEPLIKCHYRDKPSVIPCKDSPPIDKGKKSFW